MNIAHTRAMVRAALAGALDDVPTRLDPNFGSRCRSSCPDVPAAFLDPRSTWADPAAYDAAAAGGSRAMFRDNFAGLRRRRRARRDRGGRAAAERADSSGSADAGDAVRPRARVGRRAEQDRADDERPEAERQRDRRAGTRSEAEEGERGRRMHRAGSR